MVLAGCQTDSTAGGNKAELQTPLTLAEAQDVVVTRHFMDATVEITAHPIQVKDGVAALSMDYKLVEPSEILDYISMNFQQEGGENLRLLDTEKLMVYQVLNCSGLPMFR
ncbi:MAG: hypothetical protein FWG14_12375 [Peptococcaceae bacterium]|nr:hypothetical protein [Peptococcaceae bacterium]